MAELRTFFLILFLLSGAWQLSAQEDTLKLKAVDVVETRARDFAVGSELITLDSSSLKSRKGQNLTEVLNAEGLLFIKNYSPGNLATTSFRGANAQQTVVTWNGFNINSPLHGQFDLSLFPVQALDQVQLQPGASSALWGSGAVGGSIHLGHTPDFTPHWELYLAGQAGSFDNFSQNIGMTYGSANYSGHLNLLNQNAENNFPFTNPYTGETQTQENNHLSNQVLTSANHFRLSSKDLLNLHLWFQQTDRDIPPSLFEISRSNQRDDVMRISSEWLHSFQKTDLKVRAAYFNEDQVFNAITADSSYHNASQSFIGEVEWSYQAFTRHRFDLGFNQSVFLADVDSYNSEGNIQQNRQAIFAGYCWDISSTLSFSNMLRQEIIDGRATPFTFTTGLAWQALPQLQLKGQFSKVYRAPTLNDLYWVPGGQRDLQSEYGYAQELSATWKYSLKKWRYQIGLTAYNRNITNWVVWLPQRGIWSPQNLLEVHSRGLGSRSQLQWKKKNWNILLNLNTNYTLSTNQKAVRANDASVGKQLIYTPIYSGAAALSTSYKSYTLRYQHQYTGYTYTTSDHSEFLEPYHIGSLYLAYEPGWKKLDGHFFARIDNIWNHQYQVVRNRPMPGVQYSIGLQLNFKLKQFR